MMTKSRLGLLVCLCVLLCAPAYGWNRDNAVVSVFERNNSTGFNQSTEVSLTAIPRNSRILGIVVMSLERGLSSENVVSLYDTIRTTEGGVSEVIAEAEAANAENNAIWFEYPMKVQQQLTIVQGGNTSIQIYYEK